MAAELINERLLDLAYKSAILHSLEGDARYAKFAADDRAYADGRGRKYYVRKLVKGPTTERHGAYLDVLRANIEEATGMWPEAPAVHVFEEPSKPVWFFMQL